MYYQVDFTVPDGEIEVLLSLGRTVDGSWQRMSDVAVVRWRAPQDQISMNQTHSEYSDLLETLVEGYEENEDGDSNFPRWYGSDASIWKPEDLEESAFDDNSGKAKAHRNEVIIAHLNNQLN